MKKLISLLSVILMIAVLCPNTAFAEEKVVTDSTIEYFEDGSYIVTELSESTVTTFAAQTKAHTRCRIFITVIMLRNGLSDWMLLSVTRAARLPAQVPRHPIQYIMMHGK